MLPLFMNSYTASENLDNAYTIPEDIDTPYPEPVALALTEPYDIKLSYPLHSATLSCATVRPELTSFVPSPRSRTHIRSRTREVFR